MTLAFDPRRDGFAFANAFSWTPADTVELARWLRAVSVPLALALVGGAASASGGRRGAAVGAGAGACLGVAGLADGLVGAVARRWATFGLCGGMALTAAERWRLGTEPATASLQAGPLRALLWRQQRRTLVAAGPAFAASWLRLRFPGNDASRTLAATWTACTKVLASGRPVVIGLAGRAWDPAAMHQVLAFGLREEAAARTLLVYDPNVPGVTVPLRLRQPDGRWRMGAATGFETAFVVAVP